MRVALGQLVRHLLHQKTPLVTTDAVHLAMPLAVALLATTCLPGVLAYAGRGVSDALTFRLQSRVMARVDSSPGIDLFLESDVQLNLALARGALGGYFPADAPMHLATVLSNRLAGLIAIGLVAQWRPAVALVLAGIWLFIGNRIRAVFVKAVTLFVTDADELRRAQYFEELVTGLDGAKELRVFGLRDWLVDQYRLHFLGGMEEVWRQRGRLNREGIRLGLLGAIGYAIAFALLLHDAYSGGISLPHAVVLLLAVPGVSAIGTLGGSGFVLEFTLGAYSAYDAVERSLKDLSRPDSDTADAREQPRRLPLSQPEFAVELQDVRFRYPAADVDAIDGLTLKIRARTSTAIVGANGVGKSTLVKVIAGLYTPASGRVALFGCDTRFMDRRSWQRTVSCVFQDVVKYTATARTNIAFGSPCDRHDDLAIRTAAERAGILSDIERLPAGLDTVLSAGEAGADTELSGGQWQRLALARALFAADHGSQVLILDEPTAFMDARAEASFHSRFLELTRGLTTIVISHRFSTVRQADRIVVLDDQGVVEEGSHSELMAKRGTYARSFSLQAERFEDEAAT
jgi:ATP-binding cassette, subfamily B, bacterial